MMNKLYLFETFQARMASRKSGQALRLLVQAYADALRDKEGSLQSLDKVERWIDQLLHVRKECLCDVGKSHIKHAAEVSVKRRAALDAIHADYNGQYFSHFLREWGKQHIDYLRSVDIECDSVHPMLVQGSKDKEQELLVNHYLRVFKKRLQEAMRCLLFPVHKDGTPNEFDEVTVDNFAEALVMYKEKTSEVIDLVGPPNCLGDDALPPDCAAAVAHRHYVELLQYVAKFSKHELDDDNSVSVVERICESLEPLDPDLSRILDDISSEFLTHQEES